jgi:hypothetical protein
MVISNSLLDSYYVNGIRQFPPNSAHQKSDNPCKLMIIHSILENSSPIRLAERLNKLRIVSAGIANDRCEYLADIHHILLIRFLTLCSLTEASCLPFTVHMRSGSGLIPTLPRSSLSASQQAWTVASSWQRPPVWPSQAVTRREKAVSLRLKFLF